MKLSKIDFFVLLVIFLVPLMCVVVFGLPFSVQLSLAAKGDVLDPAIFVSSVFVHGNLAHLVGNVVVFLIFGLLVFSLNKIAGSQRFLLVALAWVILLVPLLYGFFVWAFSDVLFHGIFSRYSFGLSLVVGGVMGLVVPSAISLLHAELRGNVNRALLFLGLLMLTGSLMIKGYLESSLIYWAFFAAITMSGLGLLVLAFFRIMKYVRGNMDRWIMLKLSLIVLTMFLYFSFMPDLFPAQIVMPKLGTVNIFAHYFGVTMGIIPGIYLVIHEKKK